MTGPLAPDVQAYIDAIDPAHRPLFDRVQRLVLEASPDADVVIAYGMPTYKAGSRSMNIGVWKHGVSIYGWRREDGSFLDRHPELKASKGTIRLSPEAAEALGDDELRDLFTDALRN